MDKRQRQDKQLEVLLWSIAFPGFGQLLNKKYVKGIVFVILEVMINVKGNINQIILLSFTGEMNKAIEQADFLWVLFYPCIYCFAIWDAYKDAGNQKPYNYLSFVFSAYFGTLGVIYSMKVNIFGYLLGPVFLPIIAMLFGALVGNVIKILIYKRKKIT